MTDQERKICLVIPSLHAGGMERVMCELADYFNTIPGIRVYMVILGKTNKFYEVSPRIEIIEPEFNFNNKFRFLYTVKTILFLRNSIKNIKPTAILSFGEMYNSFVLFSTYFYSKEYLYRSQ
jgi:GalNAc-alpha-(1->4)-GalNAc-alpha-(1->3)-diNAcBac-PP-undecaprenol alpha-1,4-N-acetyl-D-galactosaminyltransferase